VTYILLTTCRDVPGISAAVTGFLTSAGGFILESRQFGDPETDHFFLRIAFRAAEGSTLALNTLRTGFAPIAERFGMSWSISDAGERPRTLIAVSKFGHCLNDLLHRWRTGVLPIEVVGVVSNHDDMRALVEWHDVPYYHLPITRDTKAEQEDAFGHVIKETRADLVVLARYMQILSADFSRVLAGRCINIHHSFLPSFKGAKPYHQAHVRGVKIIGATAHYVTDDLDEGPIIEQDVERVDHDRTAAYLVETGQDIEARVLARAVRWHAERRVLLNGSKTVVFR
jgi:formyltetrahydrofolate deformylase